uniref:Uncharacterized protein n=1 Tax=Glossina pallidipes TaxID=7398 RepID=A0A1B0ACJ4_GLOPL
MDGVTVYSYSQFYVHAWLGMGECGVAVLVLILDTTNRLASDRQEVTKEYGLIFDNQTNNRDIFAQRSTIALTLATAPTNGCSDLLIPATGAATARFSTTASEAYEMAKALRRENLK